MGTCQSKKSVTIENIVSTENILNDESSKSPIQTEPSAACYITTASPSTGNFREIQRRNVEELIVVWLNTSDDTNSKHAERLHSTLRNIANGVEIFSNSITCQTFIQTVKDERIFLIVSGTFESTFITQIHPARQVDSIYLYSVDKEKYEYLAHTFMKIRGIFTETSSLYENLLKDMKKSEYSLIGFDIVSKSANIIQSSSNARTNTQEANFMYAQLFKEILLQSKDDNLNGLIDFCQTQYEGNSKELTLIKEFQQTYRPDKAIWWYSREGFLYKMVNRALRTQDIETMYALRMFIRHLHEQLIEVQKSIDGNIYDGIKLYRGQRISNDELETLKKNEGGLLSISNFLSTSGKLDVALMFANNQYDEQSTSILFEIILSRTKSTVFACIDHISQFGTTENEWLFSMGSVFRIGTLKKMTDGLWHLNLTVTDDNDFQLTELTQYMQSIFQFDMPLLAVCTLMFEMGDYKRAKDFGLTALSAATNWEEESFILNDLGLVHSKTGQLEQALDYFRCSIEVMRPHIDEYDARLSNVYHNMGLVYHEMGELALALENYHNALKIRHTTMAAVNNESIAGTYNNIGTVLVTMGKLDEALIYLEKALNLRIAQLPPTHPSIGDSYNNIAFTYNLQEGRQDEASSMYKKSLSIYSASLAPNHPSIGTAYDNIGSVYRAQNRMNDALEMYNKCLQIRLASLPFDHPLIVESYEHIAQVYTEQKCHEQAQEIYEKCIEILPLNHPSLAFIYAKLGARYQFQGLNSKAQELFDRSRQIYEATLPLDSSAHPIVYSMNGLVNSAQISSFGSQTSAMNTILSKT